MLCFAAFDDRLGQDLSQEGMRYLFGVDGVPAGVPRSFEQGVLCCETTGDEALGLACIVNLDRLASVRREGDPELGPLGTVMLQTCQVRARKGPMLLSLELARQRVMSFLNKLEDWGLFDLEPDHPIMEAFNAGRALFTSALVAHAGDGDGPGGYDAAVDRIACRALLRVHAAGEELAREQSRRLWARRVDGTLHREASEHYERVQDESPPPGAPILLPSSIGVVLPGRPLIGCAVSPKLFSEPLARVASSACDFVTMPVRWRDIEPQEGKYVFGPTDRWIEWAVRTAKMPVAAGPLIDFRPSAVPEWLYIWENDYETLRELVAEHVKQVVTRYRRTVRRWTVLSGVHVNKSFPMTFEQMMDLTRICVGLVRRLHPQANVVLELDRPWGEYFAFNRKSVPPQLYAEMVLQAQIPIDGIGLRVQFGADARPARDLLSLSAMLDRFSELEKPLLLSAVGTPSDPVPGADAALGSWHGPATEALQAEWLTEVVSIAACKPYMHSVCWSELYDHDASPSLPGAGLISRTGAAKPALQRLAEIKRATRAAVSPLASAGAEPTAPAEM